MGTFQLRTKSSVLETPVAPPIGVEVDTSGTVAEKERRHDKHPFTQQSEHVRVEVKENWNAVSGVWKTSCAAAETATVYCVFWTSVAVTRSVRASCHVKPGEGSPETAPCSPAPQQPIVNMCITKHTVASHLCDALVHVTVEVQRNLGGQGHQGRTTAGRGGGNNRRA